MSVTATPTAIEERLAPVLAAAVANAADVDRSGRFPREAVDALRESGLCGLTVTEADGGLGGSPHDLVEVMSSVAAACGSTAMVYLMHIAATMPVAAAPPSGHPGLLREMASGAKLGTLAFSERGSRSHFWAPVSRQTQSNGSVAVSAMKSWVTSAGEADIIVSSALVPEGGPNDSDLFAIPRETRGMEPGGPWTGMGLRGNDSRPMSVNVEIPANWRLGSPGEGFRLMMEAVLPWFNLGNASVSLGFATAAVDGAVKHATGSSFQHLGESLADLPTIRAQLARMHIRTDALRSYLHEVAGSLMQPDDRTQLRVLASKAYANDTVLEVTDMAMRVCGGAAFSQHLAIDRFFRDARAGHVMAPTADMLYDFYGKAITGRPLF